jgi:hypothetical protein
MNKIRIIVFIPAFLVFALLLPAQQEEPIKEAVSVVNVEVPVRVFSDGKSVSGLSRDDFEISEDGKSQQINGFYVLQKKLSEPAAARPAAAAGPQTPGRYFVLVFRTYEFNEQLENGIYYLFKNIFLPDDQVLVLTQRKNLFFERLDGEEDAQDKICELVKTESQYAQIQMLGYLRQVEQSVNLTQFQISLRSASRTDSASELRPDYITRFLEVYLETWRDFKRRYLSLDINKYYYFSRLLERVKKEKWVLNFYQMEQFPQIALNSEIRRALRSIVEQMEISSSATSIGQARLIKQLLQSIDMEMKVSDSFPTEEVSKLFYKVNATFHSFFMRVFKDSGGSEVQFQTVANDLENSLRSLTQQTGGELIASNEIGQSLADVSERTDDYYMLTYEPSNPKKVGKIKVTVKGKKYKVLYDDNLRADYISTYLQKMETENPSVKIKDLSFKDKKLSLAVVDYSRGKIKDETTGVLQVRIRIKNSDEQMLFDQTKALKAPQNTFSLSLNFNFLAAGKYDIIIDVLDQVSGKSCTEVIQPLVE